MKITTIPTWRTPSGTVAFIPIGDTGNGYRYRLSVNGVIAKSWWKKASATMCRFAVLRAAAKAASLPEYHYIDTRTSPSEWPASASQFDGIHQPHP